MTENSRATSATMTVTSQIFTICPLLLSRSFDSISNPCPQSISWHVSVIDWDLEFVLESPTDHHLIRNRIEERSNLDQKTGEVLWAVTGTYRFFSRYWSSMNFLQSRFHAQKTVDLTITFNTLKPVMNRLPAVHNLDSASIHFSNRADSTGSCSWISSDPAPNY